MGSPETSVSNHLKPRRYPEDETVQNKNDAVNSKAYGRVEFKLHSYLNF
jgi:hypothetical protein